MHQFGKLAYAISRQVTRLARDRSGATAVEYAMIASGIAVIIATAVGGLGMTTKGMFDSVAALFN
jgi:pilus assembly protein Flp/PilA